MMFLPQLNVGLVEGCRMKTWLCFELFLKKFSDMNLSLENGVIVILADSSGLDPCAEPSFSLSIFLDGISLPDLRPTPTTQVKAY